jgi:hypothetical protein
MLHRKCKTMVGWFVLLYREGHNNYDQLLFNMVFYVTIIQFIYTLTYTLCV